jgi:hypothetical protein
MKLSDIFDNVSRQMQLDFDQARAAITHPGLKGSAFEEAFREFLRRYLPRKLDVLQGIIVDAQGKSSKQLDVIVCDSASTPVFYESGDTRVVPSDSSAFRHLTSQPSQRSIGVRLTLTL